MKKFADLQQEHWKEVLYDTCKEDYNRLWFRDGNVAKISHDKNGMTITSGPEFLNDEHHEVLWTKAEFKGDLKIEYDFTRLDNEKRCVNILYMIQMIFLSRVLNIILR